MSTCYWANLRKLTPTLRFGRATRNFCLSLRVEIALHYNYFIYKCEPADRVSQLRRRNQAAFFDSMELSGDLIIHGQFHERIGERK